MGSGAAPMHPWRRPARRGTKREVLPGFEPGSLDSKSRVLTNYTIRPLVVVGAAVSVADDMPSWLSWQSARLLTDRSLVRAQVRAYTLEGQWSSGMILL